MAKVITNDAIKRCTLSEMGKVNAKIINVNKFKGVINLSELHSMLIYRSVSTSILASNILHDVEKKKPFVARVFAKTVTLQRHKIF